MNRIGPVGAPNRPATIEHGDIIVTEVFENPVSKGRSPELCAVAATRHDHNRHVRADPERRKICPKGFDRKQSPVGLSPEVRIFAIHGARDMTDLEVLFRPNIDYNQLFAWRPNPPRRSGIATALKSQRAWRLRGKQPHPNEFFSSHSVTENKGR